MPKFLDKVIMSPTTEENKNSNSYKTSYQLSGLITTIGIFIRHNTSSPYSSLPLYLYLPPLLMSEKDYVQHNFCYTGIKGLQEYLETVLTYQQGGFSKPMSSEFFIQCFTTNTQSGLNSATVQINYLHIRQSSPTDISAVYLGDSLSPNLLLASYAIDGELICHNIYS